MSFGGQQPPSAGRQLTFSPTAVEENGQMVRQLQADPLASPQKRGLLEMMQGSPAGQAIAQAPMSGGAGWQPMSPTQDPNVAATMQNLQGLLADSKQKKMMFAKAMMGGG